MSRSRQSHYSKSILSMARGDIRDYEHLPNIILRCFGINHCFWGIVLLILGFVELGVTADDIETYWNPTTSRFKTYAYYAPVTLLFSSILIIIAGVLGLVSPMSYNPIRRAALESGFKNLSILISVIFGPMSFGIGITYAVLVDTDKALGGWGVAVAVIAGLETFITWFVGCMACCWAPYHYDDKPKYKDYTYRYPSGLRRPEPNVYSVDPPPFNGYYSSKPEWVKHF